MNKFFLAICGFVLLLQTTIAQAAFGIEKIDEDIKGGDGVITAGDEGRFLADNVSGIVSNFLMFLYILAVIVVIYAGFLILTAAGDEEKVKKAKNIIIFAIIGLVVIYLAGAIVTWLIESLLI